MTHRAATFKINLDLHNRLIARQSYDELKRKATKAQTVNIWTQEIQDLKEREFEIWLRERRRVRE